MLGRHELLVLLTEVELALLQCGLGTSRCSSWAVAMAIFRKFSCVTAARLDILIDDDDEGDDEEGDDEVEEDDDDDDDERRMGLTCSSIAVTFGRGVAMMML